MCCSQFKAKTAKRTVCFIPLTAHPSQSPFFAVWGTVLAVALLAGCVMTRGIYSEEMDSKAPYRFICTESGNACAEAIMQTLVESEFDVQLNEVDTGRLRAKKLLTPNERMFLSGPTAAVTGAEVKRREGTLAFALAETDTTISVRMKGLLTLAPSERPASADAPPDTTTAPRGHPLMIRYGLRLHETTEIEIVEPTAGRLESERVQSR